MKSTKLTGFLRGLAAVMASVFVLTTVAADVVEVNRTAIDGFLGTESYQVVNDESATRFKSDYSTVEEMAAAAKDYAIREGEEGTVIMKNDNGILPLKSGTNVALFGLAAYAPYIYKSGNLKAGNDDAVDLVQALTEAGLKVNESLQTIYADKILQKTTKQQGSTTVVKYANIYVTAPGDMTDYQIVEIAEDRFEELGVPSDWKSSIDKDTTVGICVFARGAGETNTYAPGSAVDSKGNATGKDPLALSDEELAVVDMAKATCSQVLVLINSGNAMMISDIAEGGAHEVDGIAYIGVINDYQLTGVANVLTGKVNATGALPDTYPVDHASNPAVVNFGGDYYADYEIVGSDGTDDARYPGVVVENVDAASFSNSKSAATYNGGTYVVEAEGIYVGYKYYETRYYDSVMNPDFKAASAAGATQDTSWSYGKEVVYSFGHGLSYLDYEQNIKSVTVDNSENGNITAVIEVKNLSDTDGRFLTQLYVQQPYTDYDRENLVEKSAVMFLNSAKVDVKAGETAEVTVTVPTKYLASYDYKNARTYILDAGDYLFTAAAGAHEATNNILTAQGKTVEDGMDAAGKGTVATWNLTQLDQTTFAVQNGTTVTNVADDVDLNYWTGTDTVTYLSRQDWEGTYPINYNEVEVKIGDSPRKEEWIAALRGNLYTIQSDDPATEGTDKGLRLSSSQVSASAIENIDDPYWDELVSQILIDEAVGAVIHGGKVSDSLTNIENPTVVQNEGVSGFTNSYVDEETGKKYRFNVHSQTLLGSSFNPELAYEWGLIEGNSGLWLNQFAVWGTGLTQRRTPYNGRNYEYLSEDPMLTNRMGYGILQGCADKGIMNGPKHMGFNDQEHNRAGVSAYMTEQKFRETDLRCFQGGLSDAKGLAVMIAFNRVGPTNAACYRPLLTTILREEWGFKGLISTDMMNNSYYFNAESMIMAGVTQVADFAENDNHINQGEDGADKEWTYLSLDGSQPNTFAVNGDSALVEQARQDLKYQLYAFANSAALNVQTERVATWYDTALNVAHYASLALACLAGLCWLVLCFKKKEEV